MNRITLLAYQHRALNVLDCQTMTNQVDFAHSAILYWKQGILMKLRKLAIATAVSALLGGVVQAQDYEVPETQWGQPDLQGVWNFSSTIPLERPAFFADKAYLTEQDLATIKARTRQYSATLLCNTRLSFGVRGPRSPAWCLKFGPGLQQLPPPTR